MEGEHYKELLRQLEDVKSLDYVVSLHSEQDHSGAIPRVLEKFPKAKVVTNPKGKKMLMDLLFVEESSFLTVEDGEVLSLGDCSLEFTYTPWVHWPETMCAYMAEEQILFSCDFFGSHIATSETYVTDACRVHEAAKRYFAEIMMPFCKTILKNLDKLAGKEIKLIAPSHGPVYDDPLFIIEAYRQWLEGPLENKVVLPFISMHGSTEAMTSHLSAALVDRGVMVERFNLAYTDIGKLAIALVDAATIVVGTPTVLTGPHPNVVYAAFLANALRPRAAFASVIGSYGWGGKAVETVAGLISNLKVEIVDPVLSVGAPQDEDFAALDALADAIAEKHKGLGLK